MMSLFRLNKYANLFSLVLILVFLGAIFLFKNNEKKSQERKDFTSHCDFSYFSNHEKLKKCVFENYKKNDWFLPLKETLVKEDYLISERAEGNIVTYAFLIGQNEVFSRNILVEVENEKISSIVIYP